MNSTIFLFSIQVVAKGDTCDVVNVMVNKCSLGYRWGIKYSQQMQIGERCVIYNACVCVVTACTEF